jgi:hypothetical protein
MQLKTRYGTKVEWTGETVVPDGSLVWCDVVLAGDKSTTRLAIDREDIVNFPTKTDEIKS